MKSPHARMRNNYLALQPAALETLPVLQVAIQKCGATSA